MSLKDEYPGVDFITLINKMTFPNPLHGVWYSTKAEALAAYQRDDDDDADVRNAPVVVRTFTRENWTEYDITDEQLREVFAAILPGVAPDENRGSLKAKIRNFANENPKNFHKVFDLLEPYTVAK